MDAGEYCRAVESYLCRKNDGHLIRIVGPAFEMVCAWAKAGIPLSVVRRGIDQRYTRYYGRGPRRYPVRIEFCEADILSLFDDWKRAVRIPGAIAEDAGVRVDPDSPDTAAAPARAARRTRRPLAGHLDGVAAALADWTPPPGHAAPALARAMTRARDAVDDARSNAGSLRGAARRAVVERLAALDDALTVAARRDTDAATTATLQSEAAGALSPFRARMRPDAFAAALDTATDHLLADHWRLPRLRFE